MKLYLVRHGDALSKAEDPARPLSEAGRAAVERVATAASHASIAPERVAHSDKLRARQTAEILAAALGSPEMEELTDLAPNTDPAALKGQISDGLMLVGHLPQLERVVAWLLTGDSDRALVTLAAGALVRLEGNDDDGWRLTGLVTPDFV